MVLEALAVKQSLTMMFHSFRLAVCSLHQYNVGEQSRSRRSWLLCRSRTDTMSNSAFWSVTFSRVLSTYAIVIFAVLWVGFAIAPAANREWLDLLWNWVRALPPVTEIIVWVLFLPGMVGLWIWESSWSASLRLLVLAGIVGWALVAVSSFSEP
jgi:hypothetical protein